MEAITTLQPEDIYLELEGTGCVKQCIPSLNVISSLTSVSHVCDLLSILLMLISYDLFRPGKVYFLHNSVIILRYLRKVNITLTFPINSRGTPDYHFPSIPFRFGNVESDLPSNTVYREGFSEFKRKSQPLKLNFFT